MIPYQTAGPTPETTPSAEFLDAEAGREKEAGTGQTRQIQEVEYATQFEYVQGDCTTGSSSLWLLRLKSPELPVCMPHHLDKAGRTAGSGSGSQSQSQSQITFILQSSISSAANRVFVLLQSSSSCPITAASAATPPPSWLQISFSLKGSFPWTTRRCQNSPLPFCSSSWQFLLRRHLDARSASCLLETFPAHSTHL